MGGLFATVELARRQMRAESAEREHKEQEAQRDASCVLKALASASRWSIP